MAESFRGQPAKHLILGVVTLLQLDRVDSGKERTLVPRRIAANVTKEQLQCILN